MAIVLKRHPGPVHTELVLRQFAVNAPQPYATHWHDLITNTYIWGHYCATLTEVERDFLSRAAGMRQS